MKAEKWHVSIPFNSTVHCGDDELPSGGFRGDHELPSGGFRG